MSKQNTMVLTTEEFPDMATFIDWLFGRLHAKYGSEWARQYDGLPIGDAKSDWGSELAWTFGRQDVIRFALQNLPERCPNSIQFRNICRAAPAKTAVLLAEPKSNPVFIKEVLSKLAAPAAKTDGREWARRKLAAHAAGDRVGVFGLKLARQALGMAA